MSKKVIYLAHKIRDERGPYWMEQHVRQAEAIAIDLWAMGAAVICPGKNTQWFDGALPDAVWLEGDLEIIRRCDAVVMAPNWVTSKGACAEKVHALALGKPVFEWGTGDAHSVAAIQRFIDNENPRRTD